MTILLGTSLARHNISRIDIYLFLTLLIAGCTHNEPRIGQPFMIVPHPGKYQLAYYTPPKDFPLYSMATVDDREFLVKDDVVIPSAQSLYLLTYWKIFEGETVLDIGTGSGVQAIFAADKASKVVATDISLAAVEMARLNAKRNGVSKIVEVRKGDLFAPIKSDEKFDVILFNIDYPHNEKTQSLWKLHERFFAEVKEFLKRGGRIYYQSGNLENVSRINDMANKNSLSIVSVRMDSALEVDRQPIVYLIKRSIDLEVKASVVSKP